MNESNSLDYYQIVGVSNQADSNEIRTAYRKASLKVHPDRAGRTTDTPNGSTFSHILITTDLESAGLSEWALRAIVDTPGTQGITIDAAYFLCGKLLGNNDNLPEYFLYDPTYTLISKTPTFQPAEIVNCVGITSFGRLLSIESASNLDGAPLLVFIVQHREFNPFLHNFTVEYWVARSKLDEDLVMALTVNSHVFCVGSIVGRNEDTNRWIIEVTKLVITSINHTHDLHQDFDSLQL